MNVNEQRRFGVEARNDRNMILATVSLGLLGAFYGVAVSSGWYSALLGGVGYGLLGLMVGPPLAFAFNMTRSLLR